MDNSHEGLAVYIDPRVCPKIPFCFLVKRMLGQTLDKHLLFSINAPQGIDPFPVRVPSGVLLYKEPDFCFKHLFVGGEGLEPSSLTAYGPEPYVSTNCTIRPTSII